MMESISTDNQIVISRFTTDSLYLLCGDTKGYLLCYDISDNFY